jgi:hypothetical protein
MKFLLSLFFLVFALLFAAPQAVQAQGDVLASAKTALKVGGSKELTRHFNQMVELAFDGNKSRYSQTQAEFVLKDFFAKNPPASFEIIHEGSSKDGLKYAIGKYSYKGGSYRVYMLIKQFKSVYLIDTIDFTKE